MNFRWKLQTAGFSIFIFTFFFCEYIIYYLVIRQCSWPVWPEHQSASSESMIKSMILADTHLLGPYRGHWFDKLRREWQMHRSFQTAISLFNPEVVFVLGDLFDEGKWSDRKLINEYIRRFFSLFKLPEGVQLFVVPGNHDVGFHFALRPFILDKFERAFNTSNVQLVNLKGSYFVLINSMAMEGDGCYLCTRAEKKLKQIGGNLRCIRDGNCAKLNEKYTRPIILQHFPMYRKSDSNCSDVDSAPPNIKQILFKEKWDCLSKKASEMIYDELNPRAIFTGHAHHACHTIHREDIHEFTISSFSWRNKMNPSFILAKITPEHYIMEKCFLPAEYTVIGIYILVLTFFLIWICYTKRHLYFRKSLFIFKEHSI